MVITMNNKSSIVSSLLKRSSSSSFNKPNHHHHQHHCSLLLSLHHHHLHQQQQYQQQQKRFYFNDNKSADANSLASLLTRDMVGQPFPHTHPHLFPTAQHSVNRGADQVIAVGGFTRGEFRNRREKLRSFLSHDGEMVILSATVQSIMTNDIPYTYRADSNLYYLTGCSEQHCIVVIGRKESFLFVQDKNGKEEQWGGPRSGVHAMRELLNGESEEMSDLQVESLDKFEMVMSHLLMQTMDKDQAITLHMDPKKDQAITQRVIDAAGGHDRFATSESDAKLNRKVLVLLPNDLLAALRSIKSEQEVAILKRTAEISNQAFRAAMSATRPGMSEAHLEAIMEFQSRLLGAQRLAYPPVVATGNNANVIHYVRNTSQLLDGQLVVIDAGAEYNLYPSDVTRAWPVNGKFNSAQRILYEAVLDVQKSTISYLEQQIKKGKDMSIRKIHDYSVQETNRHIVDTLGLKPVNKQIMGALYPHTIGHPLGMDIHEDVPIWDQKLKPGMVITIEPGIYIPSDSGHLVGTSNRDLLGNGVRIEDNILITANGIEVLTKAIPKEIDEVEEVCQQDHPLNSYIHSNYSHF